VVVKLTCYFIYNQLNLNQIKMETQVQNQTAQVQTIKAIPVESAKSLSPTILIERILEPRQNPEFQGILMRWKTERSGPTTSLVSFALGGATEENRGAVQTFKKDVIAKFGIVAGKNMNDILKAAGMELARLTISEITESDYDGLSEQDKASYSAKVNPSSGEILTKNGETIYRKVFLDSVTGQDSYVQHDGTSEGSSNPVV
jgi:hypothetical protein